MFATAQKQCKATSRNAACVAEMRTQRSALFDKPTLVTVCHDSHYSPHVVNHGKVALHVKQRAIFFRNFLKTNFFFVLGAAAVTTSAWSSTCTQSSTQ